VETAAFGARLPLSAEEHRDGTTGIDAADEQVLP